MSSQECVLIAGFTGQALAASARKAGFVPLVADAFADEDTKALAHAFRRVPAHLQTGFRRGAIRLALEELAAEAPSPPIGLILGAGFETTPKLAASLQERFGRLGCTGEAIRRLKDPAEFFTGLTELGIRHPEWRPPTAEPRTAGGEREVDAGEGWLVKRVGGSGGSHIRRWRPSRGPGKLDRGRHYLQRKIAGEAVSALALAASDGAAFAFTRSWCAPLPGRPYRYGGSAGHLTLDADLEARIIDAGQAVIKAFGLVGLVSLDFVAGEDDLYLVEVNPRPGASLPVLDDASGTLFSAHVMACRGEAAVSHLARNWQPRCRAAGYLYADEGPLEIGDLPWPDFVTDRPAPGSRIGLRDPVVTVHAEAGDAFAAERLCRQRLAELSRLLYAAGKVD